MIEAGRFHDFSAGHRVMGHENKCAAMHGHNYRVHFDVRPLRAQKLDSLGRVLDFGGIKVLCDWLEEHWDHKFLCSDTDEVMSCYANAISRTKSSDWLKAAASFVWLPFNPTAENMAIYLGTQIAPHVLPADVYCASITLWETRKCYSIWTRD